VCLPPPTNRLFFLNTLFWPPPPPPPPHTHTHTCKRTRHCVKFTHFHPYPHDAYACPHCNCTARQVELAKQWSYIDTYGAFYVHCGATSMGCPADADTHPTHGELPNAPYQSAQIRVGTDSAGECVG
jgi:hypothetical protein